MVAPNTQPDDKKKALANSWDRNAANWTRAVREGLIASRKAGTDAAILDAIAARKPRHFLDAGCGEGFHVRCLRELTGCETIGFDGSATLVDAARAADPDGRYEHLTYDRFAGDPAALPGPFDVVAFNYALFDEDVTPLLAAARSRLAPGGAVVIQTLHPDTIDTEDGWRTEDFAAFGDGGWTPMPWYFRTMASWQQSLEDAGLSVAARVEPRAMPDGAPLSLLLVCEAA